MRDTPPHPTKLFLFLYNPHLNIHRKYQIHLIYQTLTSKDTYILLIHNYHSNYHLPEI